VQERDGKVPHNCNYYDPMSCHTLPLDEDDEDEGASPM